MTWNMDARLTVISDSQPTLEILYHNLYEFAKRMFERISDEKLIFWNPVKKRHVAIFRAKTNGMEIEMRVIPSAFLSILKTRDIMYTELASFAREYARRILDTIQYDNGVYSGSIEFEVQEAF